MAESDDHARLIAEETARLDAALRQSEGVPASPARDYEERINTREHHLIQRVLKRERRAGLAWKILGGAGGVVALLSWLNTNGPCSNGWKFKTIDEAAVDHAAIRTETATAITRVEGKIDKGNEAVLKAIADISNKKGKGK
jgi:hypothetical protein